MARSEELIQAYPLGADVDAWPARDTDHAMAKTSKKQKVRPPEASNTDAPSSEYEDRITRLARVVQSIRTGERTGVRTERLLSFGVPKMAQKVVEEAAEVAIDAARGERAGVINESVDLLYNLVVLWTALGISADDVWSEMDRREALLGMVEKLPKTGETDG